MLEHLEKTEQARIETDELRTEIIEIAQASEKDWMKLTQLANRVSRDTETARVELHHVHLPLLDDYNVVEYDARSNTVRF